MVFIIVQGFWLEPTRSKKVSSHRCKYQARCGAGGFFFSRRISPVINCDQYFSGALAGFVQRHRCGRADSIATGNSTLSVLNDKLATTTVAQPNTEAGQFVVEEYLV